MRGLGHIYAAFSAGRLRLAGRAVLFLLTLFSLSSCELRPAPQSAEPIRDISLSKDTLNFDSIAQGSPSPAKRVSLRNCSNQEILIKRIYLGLGESSPYYALINGERLSASHIRIRPHDSIIIIAEAKRFTNPLTDTITFLKDSLIIETEGGERLLYLRAQGVALRPFPSREILSDLTLAGPPAYLVDKNITVAAGATLTLGPKTSLYFSENTHIDVLGSLIMNGTPSKPVVMAGRRLDYRYKAGQWGGIRLKEGSHGHKLSQAIIRNATTAISAEELGAHQLEIHNSQLLYHSNYGLDLTSSTANVTGSIFGQCYHHAIRSESSTTHLRFCTLYAATSLPKLRARKGALIQLISSQDQSSSTLNAENCILWGDRDDEILFTEQKDGSKAPIFLSYCILRIPEMKREQIAAYTHNIEKNPLLKDPLYANFALKKDSPAIDAANLAVPLSPLLEYDLTGTPRLHTNGKADIGALSYRSEP